MEEKAFIDLNDESIVAFYPVTLPGKNPGIAYVVEKTGSDDSPMSYSVYRIEKVWVPSDGLAPHAETEEIGKDMAQSFVMRERAQRKEGK